ncbi:GAF domain-containing protein [Rathayibacter festucae]|uniref:GAF domain-containing protein n=1 Tax=Rathayibacter festucae DSM 15932 TaxID=1328866 RepID=A0A3T0T2E5_9MICO|nr:GAF domain-containing protein [Rathayibacter festucae]AZZ52807.1 hypothetical protein C1I64_12655 [Rathayibacter festucae DSM 15932]
MEWTYLHLSWLPAVLALVATITSAVLFGILGLDEYKAQRHWMQPTAVASTVIAVALTALLEYLRRESSRSSVFEATAALTQFRDALKPIVLRLRRMQDVPSPQRETAYQRVVTSVLDARLTLFSDDLDTRMVIYKFEGAQGRRPRRLTLENKSGRPANEPDDFVDTDGGRGEALFTWLATSPTFRFVANVTEDPDEVSGRGYETYISVPILVSDRVVGMITLDSPIAGDLDETDVAPLELLAGLLALAHGML